jgi:hypothetical protein
MRRRKVTQQRRRIFLYVAIVFLLIPFSRIVYQRLGTASFSFTENERYPISNDRLIARYVSPVPTRPKVTVTPAPTGSGASTITVMPRLTPKEPPDPPPSTPTLTCSCERLVVQGNVNTGSTVDLTFVLKAALDAEITDVKFSVQRDNTLVEESDLMKPRLLERTIDNGPSGGGIQRYSSLWNYTIDEPGSYYIKGSYTCSKQNQEDGSEWGMVGRSLNVLGEDDTNNGEGESFFHKILGWIKIFFPKNVRSLQLGTFKPKVNTNVSKGCDFVRFDVE